MQYNVKILSNIKIWFFCDYLEEKIYWPCQSWFPNTITNCFLLFTCYLTQVFNDVHTSLYPHDPIDINFVGSYLFVDASAPNNPNKEAVLESPMVQSDSAKCLRMFVNMNGKDIGQFRVYIVKNNQQQMVVDKEGEQGNRWFEENIDLPVNVPYKACMFFILI